MIRAEFPEETTALVDKVMAETPVARPRDLPTEVKNRLSGAP
jgi:hypothetical protein